MSLSGLNVERERAYQVSLAQATLTDWLTVGGRTDNALPPSPHLFNQDDNRTRRNHQPLRVPTALVLSHSRPTRSLSLAPFTLCVTLLAGTLTLSSPHQELLWNSGTVVHCTPYTTTSSRALLLMACMTGGRELKQAPPASNIGYLRRLASLSTALCCKVNRAVIYRP